MGGWDGVGLGRQVDSDRPRSGAQGGGREAGGQSGHGAGHGITLLTAGTTWVASSSCLLSLPASSSGRAKHGASVLPCPSEGCHAAGAGQVSCCVGATAAWEWGVLCLWPEKRGFVGSFLMCVEGEPLPRAPEVGALGLCGGQPLNRCTPETHAEREGGGWAAWAGRRSRCELVGAQEPPLLPQRRPGPQGP